MAPTISSSWGKDAEDENGAEVVNWHQYNNEKNQEKLRTRFAIVPI